MRRYDPSIDHWVPLTVDELRSCMAGTAAWLSGGVALDMWLGRTTRHHEDIDLSVTKDGWPLMLARLPPDLRAYRAEDGWLSPLEFGQPGDPPRNTWFVDGLGRWRLQLNVEPGDADHWQYRRDERIVLPWHVAVVVCDGIRIVAPEVQLLWKSAHPAQKDLDDWAAVLPHLDDTRRTWLRAAVALAHPGSPVLTRMLSAERSSTGPGGSERG